ncbi:thioesterase [Paenibacillus sp. GSMTC-2017]|uniref:thioesterase II family protein n=1 Tax=Paenibacillus sp. GSMTC-2017 TaxID=2794350 RepID=UPI0018D761E5|nr:thioesterase [Paenibacillus sp. GSMTC-2017]MBH5318590.1 thioesterase [Paenibacillus sp. GSMTC-2017]
MNQIPLLFLPYAGGSAQVYKKWAKALDPSIVLTPLEMAGRGGRMGESCCEDVPSAVKDLLRFTRKYTTGPYAIFGHSMGSLLAYELMRSLRDEGLRLPIAAFLSGRDAPHSVESNRTTYLLPDEAFIEEIKSLGGTSNELFQHKELLNLFMPIMRADFKLVGTYHYEPGEPLPVHMIVMNGNQDTSLCGESIEWKSHTSHTCDIVQFEGGHFFIQEHEKKVISLINDRMLGILTSSVMTQR